MIAPSHSKIGEDLNHIEKADRISGAFETARRELLKRMGLFAAGTHFWPDTLFQQLAIADEQKLPAEGTVVGQREIIMGLDGMSRVSTDTIRTPNELHAILKTESLILHIDVNWAVQAVRSRPVVLRLQELIRRDHNLNNVVVHRIDCTEQTGELWDSLSNWFQCQGADRYLMFGGYGAVVWVRLGIIVDSVHYAADVGVEKLVDRTRNTFTTKDRPIPDGKSLDSRRLRVGR